MIHFNRGYIVPTHYSALIAPATCPLPAGYLGNFHPICRCETMACLVEEYREILTQTLNMYDRLMPIVRGEKIIKMLLPSIPLSLIMCCQLV